MVINKVNINVYCNYNGTKRLNEKNPENTSYRKFLVYSGSDMGSFLTFWVYFGSYSVENGLNLVMLLIRFWYFVQSFSIMGQV